MNAASTSGSARLAAVERSLLGDPANTALLAEACDEAIAARQLERAAAHLAAAEQLGLDACEWIVRAARLAAARQDWSAALQAHVRLRRLLGDQPGISYEIALALFRMGDAAGCRRQLVPWLLPGAGVPDAAMRGSLQALWLRATQHLGLLKEAREWAHKCQAEGRLAPAAAGVASLVAVDLGDISRARALADIALAEEPPVAEALVARATVALLQGPVPAAIRWLTRALHCDPQDARTWSTLAMANLQAGDPASARAQFSHAARLLPVHIGTWHGLGWSCVLLQDRAGALPAFQQALALDGEFAESHGAVALALQLAGRDEEAQPHLARAAELDRQNATAAYARELACGRLQDAGALCEVVRRALQRPGFFRRRALDSFAPGKRCPR